MQKQVMPLTVIILDGISLLLGFNSTLIGMGMYDSHCTKKRFLMHLSPSLPATS
ncbi:hypothetical protein [Candidatus Hoaglandella endobia]|uniref:hypothetical protein n=1 Tax=Candidatus Hoaglandella endobia TaxID=1778263 RepID=UPI001315A08B|nr:hypothetical protein [Candidatus Hoaglandella endobia]